MSRRASCPLALLGVVSVLLIWSGIGPHDRFTWLLEVAPVLIGAPVLIATYRRFPLTSLLYTLLAIHAAVLILGGHYTYARVPLGFWMQDVFGFARNHYDRIGHLAQGALYELLEWCVAAATGTAAEAFLGTHGDTWDTQWDMFMALCGVVLAQLTLGRLHDRQLLSV